MCSSLSQNLQHVPTGACKMLGCLKHMCKEICTYSRGWWWAYFLHFELWINRWWRMRHTLWMQDLAGPAEIQSQVNFAFKWKLCIKHSLWICVGMDLYLRLLQYDFMYSDAHLLEVFMYRDLSINILFEQYYSSLRHCHMWYTNPIDSSGIGQAFLGLHIPVTCENIDTGSFSIHLEPVSWKPVNHTKNYSSHMERYSSAVWHSIARQTNLQPHGNHCRIWTHDPEIA